jgi:hypothetical protein
LCVCSQLPGTALGATAHNNIAGIRAHHMAIGAPWHNRPWLKLVLKGIKRTQPASSRQPKQLPTTVNHLQALDDALTDLLFDRAIFAATCIAFWGIFWLGKLLLGAIKWDPTFIPMQAAWMQDPDTNIIHLPWTKTKHLLGHPVPITLQRSRTCAISALHAYMHAVPAPPSVPLFCYPHSSPATLQPLTTCMFLDCINAILALLGYPRITGHYFCIGGTTDLLVCRVPPAIVCMAGHWHSNR